MKAVRRYHCFLALSYQSFAEPISVWESCRVFELAQAHLLSRSRRQDILEQAARELSSLNTAAPLSPEETLDLLYADLPGEQTLTTFQPPALAELLQRYELAQAQGMLYRAYNLVITAHRNDPARYW